jgi:hypothetical protein
MDDRRFDSFTKSVANRSNRRRLLTGMLGLSAGAIVAAIATDSTEAARRGFAGPKLPTPPSMCNGVGDPCPDASDCCSGCCVSAGGAPFVCAIEDICL